MKTGTERATEYLRYHGGSMERADAEREAAVSLLVDGIQRKGNQRGFNTIMNAVYYLRSGKYPLTRLPRDGRGARSERNSDRS